MAGSAQSGVAWLNDMEISGSSEEAKSNSPGDGSIDNFMFRTSSSSHTLQCMNHTSVAAV